MKVTFVSNYINHHQLPFCEAMHAVLGRDFVFLQTEQMEDERIRMGWKDVAGETSYVQQFAADPEETRELILECDILLAGWAPEAEELVEERLLAGGPTFRISERIYKDGQWKFLSPRGLMSKYKAFTRFRDQPYYLLSAGAYVGSDYSLVGAFPEKKFVWGYFPPFEELSRTDLAAAKQEGQKSAAKATGWRDAVELAWAGRFVDFKHPERVLRLAEDLKAAGLHFHLNVAGGGNGEEDIRRQVQERGLEQVVTVHGLTSPQRVRQIMKQSLIFVFPSDHGEGWGAVINEAMNSGCAVVADAEAGCIPWLVHSGVNGMVSRGGDYADFLAKTRYLVEHPQMSERYGMAGYRAISEVWNAENAAANLLNACDSVLCGDDPAKDAPSSGPMSVDPCMKPFMKVTKMRS